MKTLVTFLHMSLLDINNSNVSAILSIFLLECKSHRHGFFFFSVSGIPSDSESPQEALDEQSLRRHLTVNHLTLVEGGQLSFDFPDPTEGCVETVCIRAVSIRRRVRKTPFNKFCQPCVLFFFFPEKRQALFSHFVFQSYVK